MNQSTRSAVAGSTGWNRAWVPGDGSLEAVGERVAVPVEVFGQVVGRFGHPGTDDEPHPGLVDSFEILRGQHASFGGHDPFGDGVALLQRLGDRGDGLRLGLAAVQAGDLSTGTRSGRPAHIPLDD